MNSSYVTPSVPFENFLLRDTKLLSLRANRVHV